MQGALDIDYLLKLKNPGMVPLGNLLSPLSLFALLPAHIKETQRRAPSECVSTAVVCWDKRIKDYGYNLRSLARSYVPSHRPAHPIQECSSR
eukprot:COSAG01_NODE_74_length_28433_cov_41.582269_17_plen_92_part_00